MPKFFKDLYPTTRVVVDATEIFVEKPSLPNLQQMTFPITRITIHTDLPPTHDTKTTSYPTIHSLSSPFILPHLYNHIYCTHVFSHYCSYISTRQAKHPFAKTPGVQTQQMPTTEQLWTTRTDHHHCGYQLMPTYYLRTLIIAMLLCTTTILLLPTPQPPLHQCCNPLHRCCCLQQITSNSSTTATMLPLFTTIRPPPAKTTLLPVEIMPLSVAITLATCNN